MTTTIEAGLGHDSAPDYYLSQEQFDTQQADLIAKVEAQQPEPGIYSAWLDPRHPDANLVRTLEAQIFPEIPEIMEPFEDQCVFLTLIDTRPDAKRIIHAFRLSWPGSDRNAHTGASIGPEDIVLLKDIIDSDQGLSAEDLRAYYEAKGVDFAKSMSVETNFRVGEKVEPINGLPVAQLGYIAIFQGMNSQQDIADKAVIFAHLNRPAVASLGAVGIEYEPIAGRADLQTPTVGDEKFDNKYSPVCIPASAKNLEIFSNLTPFAAPQVEV